MSPVSAPLRAEDAPFVVPLSAVLGDVLEPDPDGRVGVMKLHRLVLAVMFERYGHGVGVGTLKRVLRATGLDVHASHVYGVYAKSYRPDAEEAAA